MRAFYSRVLLFRINRDLGGFKLSGIHERGWILKRNELQYTHEQSLSKDCIVSAQEIPAGLY